MEQTGKVFILIGAIIILLGVLILLFGNKFSWLGHLPGDIRIEKENFKFYAPLGSMLLVSAVLTFLIWVIRKFFIN
ncbi:MAG TPA: DUF2905 domain-containing protein [Bacteroidia bacterium]|nr:DUF2905 domain-containing protein [Bacteroidia bacterium]